MFDFDGLEDEETSPNIDDELEQAIVGLRDEKFTVRRDACKSLASLGVLAARCADSLGSFLSKEEDYEVQKAAVAALKAMSEAGVQPLQSLCSHRDPGMRKIAEQALHDMRKCGIDIPEQAYSNAKPKLETSLLEQMHFDANQASMERETQKHSEGNQASVMRETRIFERVSLPKQASCVKWDNMRPKTSKLKQEVVAPIESKQTEACWLEVVEPQIPDTPIEYPWPCVLLRIFSDVLPMRVEKHSMSPQELLHIWEHEWRVPYASRIKFFASEDADKKFLHPHEDIVPGSPCEVKLHAAVGSILEGLAVALKRYGGMDHQEFQHRRRDQEQEKVAAAEIRKRDNAREMHHWQNLEIQRERRLATPEDAERRRLLRIRETTPWKLKDTDATKSVAHRHELIPYS